MSPAKHRDRRHVGGPAHASALCLTTFWRALPFINGCSPPRPPIRMSFSTLRRWLPAILWMAVIFYLSSRSQLPRPRSDEANFVLRKSAHFASYALLALLYLRGLGGMDTKRRWIALLLAAAYAVSDEYHQSWIPQREPKATDVLIDTAGAAVGLIVAPAIRAVIARRARSSAADRGQADAETPA